MALLYEKETYQIRSACFLFYKEFGGAFKEKEGAAPDPRHGTTLIRGFTLIEVLIAAFLTLLVFVGILGAFNLGVRVVSQSKAKLTATNLALQQIETMRTLSYVNIGVQGSFPSGSLLSSQTKTINNIDYTINTRIDYVADSADGLTPPQDQCPQDYKRAQVTVSWSRPLAGKVAMVSDFIPANVAQECATGGGILQTTVFDAAGNAVTGPLIEALDPTTLQVIKSASPDNGQHLFVLAAASYQVRVSKSGYNSSRSYDTSEIATPSHPNPIVLENQLNQISFSIDRVSTFNIESRTPWGSASFVDSFADNTKVAESNNVDIKAGKATLKKTGSSYQSPGYLISQTIEPTQLLSWDSMEADVFLPANTSLTFQILYPPDENSWVLVPESALPGNSAGFAGSKVELSGLNPTTYPKIRVRGNFATTDENVTAELLHWEISWRNSNGTIVPNVTFNLRGNKIIGTDAQEKPVYKYDKNHTSNQNGTLTLTNMEWDNYTFGIDPGSGLDLVSTTPSPQPIELNPNSQVAVILHIDSQNSLLVRVHNLENGQPVLSAAVRLKNATLNYDVTQFTNEQGQTLFIPLQNATYSLEISAAGYQSSSGAVGVNGDVVRSVGLVPIE